MSGQPLDPGVRAALERAARVEGLQLAIEIAQELRGKVTGHHIKDQAQRRMATRIREALIDKKLELEHEAVTAVFAQSEIDHD